MPDEDFTNLQYTVEQHEGDLTKLADRITTLEHDLKLILTLPGSHIPGQITAYANQAGNPAFDQELVKAYAGLAKKVRNRRPTHRLKFICRIHTRFSRLNGHFRAFRCI
jgi:hypothetical protein